MTRKRRGGAPQYQRTHAPAPDSALDPAQEPGPPAQLVMTTDDGLRHANCLGEEQQRDPCGFILTRTESVPARSGVR